MKQMLSLFALSFLFTYVSGQSIEELNKRNGFKTLKIGDKFSKYQNNVKLLATDSTTSASIYDLTQTENDLLNIFDDKMDQILLTFDKNKNLVAIMLHKFFKGDSHFQNAIDAS